MSAYPTKKYYDLKEIENKFVGYKNEEWSNINADDYLFFCTAIQMLPKKIVDRIDKEIFFVLMGSKEKTTEPQEINSILGKIKAACIVWREDLENIDCKAVIIISPIVFMNSYEFNAKIIIHHEIAHYIIGHNNSNSTDERELAANELAKKWREDYWRLS